MHKETGIIMSGNHPRLVLDGLKTMTRRTAGLNKVNEHPDDWELVAVFQDGLARFYNTKTEEDITVKCPYGGVGDRLWVRETFRINSIGGVSYKAEEGASWIGKWKPSIHMFKKDARIWTEITELRAERVQAISEADAEAEGVVMLEDRHSFVAEFIDLWNFLNAKRGYGWDRNIWVWPITFKQYAKNA